MKKKAVGSTNTTAKKRKGFWGRFFRLIRNIFLIFIVTSFGWVVINRFLPIYLTPLMVIRSVESITQGESPKNSKRWVPIEEISPNMVQAVVCSEDNLFLSHYGFSLDAITKAFEHNQNAKRIRGGSTISQQTAKNVFLFPQRSYIRKGLEAYFTVLIELIWGKQRIMEVYLNAIEMGNGIYGIEAAAQEYFGIHASQLSKSQAAAIAACLPNPRRFNAAHPSGYIERRKSKIVSLMGKIGRIDFDKTPVSSKTNHKHKRK